MRWIAELIVKQGRKCSIADTLPSLKCNSTRCVSKRLVLYHFVSACGIFSVTLQAQIQQITCSAHRHSCQSRI